MDQITISNIAALVNLVSSLAIFWLCICKLNTRLSKKYLRVRLKFTILLVGSVASGLQPILWVDYPNTGHCILSTCLAIYLYMNSIKGIRY